MIVMQASNVFLFMLYLLSDFNQGNGWNHGDERFIRKQLFKSSEYDRLVRPKERTVVHVALNLLTINFIDIKAQTFSCTGWLTVEWEDERLQWNMTTGMESENIYALKSEIWYPELFIDNSLSDVNIINDDNLQYRVTHKGLVFWEIPRIFATHCDIDITYFPYDTQSCVIEVTSWAYSTKAQILEHLKKHVNIKELVRNGEWIYKRSYLSSKNITEEQTDGTHISLSQLDFIIVLERRPLHYVTAIILPTIIITYLSVIVFILPAQSGEKASYTLTVFLALAVLLTFIQDLMPPTALHVSYLSMYLSTCLGLNAVIVLLVVCIIRIHNQDPKKKVPRYLQLLASCFAKFCFYQTKEEEDDVINENNGYIPKPRLANKMWKERSRPKSADDVWIERSRTKSKAADDMWIERSRQREHDMWKNSIQKRANLKKYKYYARDFHNIKHVEDMHEECDTNHKIQHVYTWTEISDIIDRFLFVIMNIVIILLSVIFLFILSFGN